MDRNNNVTQYIYNNEDRITQIIDPVAKAFVFNYNSAGYLDSITDAADRTTHFEHDSEGNLTRIIEPTGDQRRFEYQPVTHLLTAHKITGVKITGVRSFYATLRKKTLGSLIYENRLLTLQWDKKIINQRPCILIRTP